MESKKNPEIKSLNSKLHDDFSIEELEQRLQTDPWICGAYVDCPSLDCGANGEDT